MARSKKPENYSFQVRAQLIIRDTQYSSKKLRCRTPEDVYELCKDTVAYAQETFQIITLNGKNYIIDRHLVGLGLVDAALVHPREIFRHAIMDSASAILLIHNHPSGDPSPSPNDIMITKQVTEAGKIVGIPVLDHIILGKAEREGERNWFSIRESGLIAFSSN